MAVDAYSVYVNDTFPVPIKGGSLTYTRYMGVKKVTPVIVSGQRDNVSSEDLEKSAQDIEFEVPAHYQGVDMATYLRENLANGASLILRNDANGSLIAYKSAAITENGEIKDDGERFMKVKCSATEVV
jgi:hypothetical protein